MKPILVLTEDADQQEEVFFNQVPVGAKLRVFGSGHTNLIVPPTNYRRWLNYSWHAVEPEGQPKAGDWTPADAARLHALVEGAHKLGYWIRFYTLDGYARLPTIRDGSSNITSARKPQSKSAGKPPIDGGRRPDRLRSIRRLIRLQKQMKPLLAFLTLAASLCAQTPDAEIPGLPQRNARQIPALPPTPSTTPAESR